MTEQEFAAIRERWAWRDRVYSEVPGSDDIAALIRAVEERDAIIHDLMVDGSHLARRAVEEFIAEAVSYAKGLKKDLPQLSRNCDRDLGTGYYLALNAVGVYLLEQSSTKGTVPDPLPPDQVRAENERLRSALKAIRDQVEEWRDKIAANYGDWWPEPDAALERLRDMASEERTQ